MRRLAALIAILAPACSHVDLAPVSSTMPLEQRMAAYESLQVTGQNRILSVSAAPGIVSISQTDELVLANGDSIVHADDLLPVVQDGSPAAIAAVETRDARLHKHEAWVITALSVIGGGALMAIGAGDDASKRGDNSPTEDAGVAIALVGGLGGLLAAWHFSNEEGRETRAAYATYDEGLRAQLQLCVSGLNVVPCEQIAVVPGAAP